MKKMIALIACMLLVLSLTACGQSAAAPEMARSLANGGTLVLRVNPEVAVEYDADGKVTGVTARNNDAMAIVSSCTGLIGQDTRTAVARLVTAIGDAGYFVEEIEGQRRQIVLEIEPGSSVPHDAFLEDVVEDIRSCVRDNEWHAPLVVDGESDYGMSDYNETDYAETDYNETDYNDTNYGPGNDGVTDYDDTDYGPNNDGVTDYDDTDYGPGNDGVTDYDDTDYGPGNDGVTDYDDTDYGPGNDGVTDYDDTDYGPNNDGVTDYTDYAADSSTNYGDSAYGESVYQAPVVTAPPAHYGSADSGYSDYDSDSGYSDYEGAS